MSECKNEFITVYRGEDRTLTLFIRDSEGQPLSLAGITEITAKFPSLSGSPVEKFLSDTDIVIVNEEGGKITVELDDTTTSLLKEATRQDFHLVLDFGGQTRIVPFLKALTVLDPPL